MFYKHIKILIVFFSVLFILIPPNGHSLDIDKLSKGKEKIDIQINDIKNKVNKELLFDLIKDRFNHPKDSRYSLFMHLSMQFLNKFAFDDDGSLVSVGDINKINNLEKDYLIVDSNTIITLILMNDYGFIPKFNYTKKNHDFFIVTEQFIYFTGRLGRYYQADYDLKTNSDKSPNNLKSLEEEKKYELAEVSKELQKWKNIDNRDVETYGDFSAPILAFSKDYDKFVESLVNDYIASSMEIKEKSNSKATDSNKSWDLPAYKGYSDPVYFVIGELCSSKFPPQAMEEMEGMMKFADRSNMYKPKARLKINSMSPKEEVKFQQLIEDVKTNIKQEHCIRFWTGKKPLAREADEKSVIQKGEKSLKVAKPHVSEKSKEPLAHKADKESVTKTLIVATLEGNVELVNELIKAGDDLSVKDNKGNGLLKIAITEGHDEIAIQLIKNGINLSDLEPGRRLQKTDALTLSLERKRYIVSKYLIDSMDKDNDSLKKALKYTKKHKLDNMVAYLKDKGVKGEGDIALENFPGVYFPRIKDHGSIEVKLYPPTKYLISINTNRSGEKCSIPNIVFDLEYDSRRKEFVGNYIENGGKVKIRYWYSFSSKEWLLKIGADKSLAKTYCAQKGKKGGYLGFIETTYFKDGYKKK